MCCNFFAELCVRQGTYDFDGSRYDADLKDEKLTNRKFCLAWGFVLEDLPCFITNCIVMAYTGFDGLELVSMIFSVITPIVLYILAKKALNELIEDNPSLKSKHGISV